MGKGNLITAQHVNFKEVESNLHTMIIFINLTNDTNLRQYSFIENTHNRVDVFNE